MTNFRPIALYNTVAKVIVKCLAMRLKNVLPTIISETQSAFVSNRLIMDNVLLTYEIHHFIKHKKAGREGYMSIKLDMMKAYDRIEWSFLKAMMIQLNFSHKWINIIMYYVTSVSYSVLVNAGDLQGISLGANTTTFSHLMFADDTLLLGRASVAEATTFMNILNQYEVRFSSAKMSQENSGQPSLTSLECQRCQPWKVVGATNLSRHFKERDILFHTQ
ncbi:hypothetical protein LIER_39691 [Lithospermum erythrorhizon]|uniref:Reverse transcriptase domain-containing protein n=1 Tax=Lithospermum erythrorhizon TaxID=34254 RepID=A0AAV3QMH3_LITER